jgi:hypothetical protein
VTKSVSVLVVGLASLIGVGAAVRARGEREAEPVPASGRTPVAASPAARSAAPAAPSSAGTAADGLMAVSQEQRDLRRKMTTVGLHEAEQRRLAALDAQAPVRAEALAAVVRDNPEAWRDVITLLSTGGDFQSAKDAVLGLRGSIDDRAEAMWTGVLLTSRRPDDRRLSLVALSDRGTPPVVAAMTIAAQEDADGAVRADALTALVLARRHCGSAETAFRIGQMLQRRKTEDPDASVRERAAALVQELVRESSPQARRPLFRRR